MLKIENLTVQVLDKVILKNFSMTIEDGEIVALMGPNGTGKSTICKVLMGDPTYTIQSGSITYNGENLLAMSIEDRSRKGLFLLNQNPLEIEGVSNAEMLRAALEARTNEPMNFFEFNKKITKICKEQNIPTSFIHRGINEGMSGGEKKKNEMLHLFILEPNLILLDELDSGLDVDALKELAEGLNTYIHEKHASLLIVTHHSAIFKYIMPKRVCVLKDGQIAKTGDYHLAEEILEHGFRYNEVSEKQNDE